jgi:NADH:ubiquinone oxidoreductase subunit F (NADH-binding)
MLKLVWTFYRNKINFSFRPYQKPGVYEIELGLSVYEFMNSDEYLGGMSSDRPLAFVPGGSSVPVLPAI